MRAKEASSQDAERSEELRFMSTFSSVPQRNKERLAELAHNIVTGFNSLMAETRQSPFERQEDVMAGMKRLLTEQVKVVESRRVYAVKLNPSTLTNVKAG